MVIQSEAGHNRAVCFSPEKHDVIKGFEEAKSPLKIKNVQRRLWNGNTEFTIQKYSKIEPINQDNMTFCYTGKSFKDDEPIQICKLSDISPEQLVSVKAFVAQVLPTVTQEMRQGPALRRQDVIIVDPTDCITLSLWEESVDVLQPQTTYLLKNIRIKSFRGRTYLNTPKDEGLFSATVSSNFEENLAEVRCDELGNICAVTGNIVGVMKVSKTSTCLSCKKQINVVSNKSFVKCANCSLSVKASACMFSWYIKILLRSKDDGSILKLDMFHRIIAKICKNLQNC